MKFKVHSCSCPLEILIKDVNKIFSAQLKVGLQLY